MIKEVQTAFSVISWLIVSHLGVKPARGGRPDNDRTEAIRRRVEVGFFEKEMASDFIVVTESLSSVISAAETATE